MVLANRKHFHGGLSKRRKMVFSKAETNGSALFIEKPYFRWAGHDLFYSLNDVVLVCNTMYVVNQVWL